MPYIIALPVQLSARGSNDFENSKSKMGNKVNVCIVNNHCFTINIGCLSANYFAKTLDLKILASVTSK